MGNQKLLKITSAHTVRYTMAEFIDMIRKHNVLWDRDAPHFHRRECRDKAWRDIAHQLYKNFDSLAGPEQIKIAETLCKRWKNTRDSFFRVQRSSCSGSGNTDRTRKYIYEKELTFLLRLAHPKGKKKQETGEDEPSSSRAASSRRGTSSRRRTRRRCTVSSASRSSRRRRTSSRQKREESIESAASDDDIEQESVDAGNSDHNEEQQADEDSMQYADDEHMSPAMKDELQGDDPSPRSQIYVAPFAASMAEATLNSAPEADTTSIRQYPSGAGNIPASVMESACADSDQAFFDAIKPVIRGMNLDQKLDFQIEILKLLKSCRSH